MIVEVYVDVSVQQTNKPFDFSVPEKWLDVVKPGMRVVVPFGPRKLLGFVTKVKERSEFTRLRPILSLLDSVPVLNAELLLLGEWLARETICFRISAYQAMLPAALKGKYKGGSVEDKIKVKATRVVALNCTAAELTMFEKSLRANAVKQRRLVGFLREHTEAIAVSDLQKQLGVTPTVIATFVDKGILKETIVEQYRNPYANRAFQQTQKLTLTPSQTAAFSRIEAAVTAEKNETFLLFGVTGSGKTEVYLQVIESALKQDKQAIMLVPEISLTPMMVERFKGRFGEQVAVLHSGLSNAEKYDEWRKIKRGEVSVVVGARSAIFAPFEQLGLIIIDEEHESTYKQEDTPRYHARDVAIQRATSHRCPVVLGSATPSLESFARSTKSVYTLLRLDERINQRQMPKVSIVDMREELRDGNRSVFSRRLMTEIGVRMERKEQVVLLLNRRGHSAFVMCRDCGLVVRCSKCDISMTYHRHQAEMKCHYCGEEGPVPRICPECSSDHIRFFGTGTQKVEEELGRLLPNARVIRMDVDTTRTKGAHEKLLKQFERGEADILLGTQMIAKGLDFPRITLVGVLSADTSLHLADFRASERTFQLLTQVSGRAGRHVLEGEVVVQTYDPEHFSIQLAAEQNFEAFYEREMRFRYQNGYVPYFYMTMIQISSEDLLATVEAAQNAYQFIHKKVAGQVELFGPTPSAIARINDRYRYQILLKYRNESVVLAALEELNEQYGLNIAKSGVFLSIDRNPNRMM